VDDRPRGPCLGAALVRERENVSALHLRSHAVRQDQVRLVDLVDASAGDLLDVALADRDADVPVQRSGPVVPGSS
jgi:hypothetical protein